MPQFKLTELCILGTQGMSYLFALPMSLLVCVPMSLHQDHFKGHCLLFSTGKWQERDGQFKPDWASQAYCNFSIFVSVITFVISLALCFRIVHFIRRHSDASFFYAFCEVLADGFLALMNLLAAVFISFGYNTWCDEMTRRFEHCSDAAGNPIDKADGIDTTDFYTHMGMCQVGIWCSFLATFTGFSFSLVKLLRYNHRENLRVSMAKERKRLINEDLVTEVSTRPPQRTKNKDEEDRKKKEKKEQKEEAKENEIEIEEGEGEEEEGPDPDAIRSASSSKGIRRIGNQIHVNEQQELF